MPWDSPWTLEFRPVLLHGVPVDRDPQTGLVGHPYVAVGIDGERLLNEVSPEGRVFDTVLKQRAFWFAAQRWRLAATTTSVEYP